MSESTPIRSLAGVALLLICAWNLPAHAAQPLVDTAWVKANLATEGVVFLDVRSGRDYQGGHIPGAVHTSYGRDGWRVRRGQVLGLLPPLEDLEKLVGRLGIGNDNHIILVAGGYSAGEMGKATRLYWTFKVLGHDAVSILDGGMLAYGKGAAPISTDVVQPTVRTFKSNFRNDVLATAADVRTALNGGVLIDSRSPDQYLGINKSGAVKRAGTLPGAKNIPSRWMTRNDGDFFRDADAIRALYRMAGVPTDGATIAFCNTGHWSSIGWFVGHEILGNKQTPMYDGSMAEWTADDANPIDRRVDAD